MDWERRRELKVDEGGRKKGEGKICSKGGRVRERREGGREIKDIKVCGK